MRCRCCRNNVVAIAVAAVLALLPLSRCRVTLRYDTRVVVAPLRSAGCLWIFFAFEATKSNLSHPPFDMQSGLLAKLSCSGYHSRNAAPTICVDELLPSAPGAQLGRAFVREGLPSFLFPCTYPRKPPLFCKLKICRVMLRGACSDTS